MRKTLYLLTAGGLLVAVAALLASQVRSAPDHAPAGAADVDAKEPKSDDEAAIRKVSAEFTAALEKGDAKAVSAFWTDRGEYVGGDGTTLQGRAAIEAAYAKAFAKAKKIKLDASIESIRFPSKDTAIEEGYAKSYRGDADQPTTSRYSVLYARENGRWLMALLREWPEEAVSLRDLDWLIGAWEATAGDVRVRTVYEWAAKKNSIRCKITIDGKDQQVTALQIVLKDPQSGELRSWTFDDDGGFGDATWELEGKRWVLSATGVQADGAELTATNILTPVDKDTFTWQSTERTLDGAALPDIAPVRVKRVK